ncbi:hypothetical protein [Paraburkholderia susongensis]|uniref:Protease inhibitor Inh n=1 Tax=Paraburkholderia susongensis TaxID=1515439 RepID=A0A1X7M3J3_9BURK|nr:hypothetical protein [Paraburkholderia susongensis]SMG59959.1 hypothetical protein SAMN06265784_114152 [Paraburkholderia susongensis]
MFKALCPALLVCLAATTCFAAEPTTAPSSFNGKWTVTDVVGYSDISGGIPEAKRLLGKVLNISSGQIEFAGERCRPHDSFSIRTVDTAPTLKDYYGINLEDTGLPSKTLLLDSENCTAVFRMDAHRVVFGWDGVIMRAVRP